MRVLLLLFWVTLPGNGRSHSQNMLLSGNRCNAFGHCGSCTSSSSWYGNCRWCTVDQQCHSTGALLYTPCHSSQNIVDPAQCPPEPASRTSFDPSIADAMIRYAACTGKDGDPKPTVGGQCYPDPKARPNQFVAVNFTANTTVGKIGTEVSCYGGAVNSGEAIVLAFRGTTDALQLFDELLRAAGIPWNGESQVINSYFAEAASELLPPIIKFMTHLLRDHPTATVWITGHSLGGALAAIIALSLVESGLVSDPLVYTLGQPRVGNQAFAKAFDKAIPHALRIVNAKDIVPHLPPCGTTTDPIECPNILEGGCCSSYNASDPAGQCDGYADFCAYHGGTEIWFPSGEYTYNGAGGAYEMCGYRECVGEPQGEDQSCGNRYAGINGVEFSIFDHFGYWHSVQNGLCGKDNGT